MYEKTVSAYQPAREDSKLGRVARRLSAAAERRIDSRYYLLHDDPTGPLFAASLLQAADRGVRVRLLLDDMDTAG